MTKRRLQRDTLTPRPCTPASLCRNWIACDRCARIRQAKIADAAELLQRYYPTLAWTILRPIDNTPEQLARARAAWARSAAPGGALWTVERDATPGHHHVNILHPPTQAVIQMHAHHWTRSVRGSVRDLAAYIAKRKTAPDPAYFAGRAFGRLGPLWIHLAQARSFPLVQAAALQHAIDPSPMRDAAATAQLYPRIDLDRTWPQRRATAARYLPDLLLMTHPPTREPGEDEPPPQT
jgi:hypothetical protein